MWAKKSTRAIESGAIAAVFFLIAVAIAITIDRFSFVSLRRLLRECEMEEEKTCVTCQYSLVCDERDETEKACANYKSEEDAIICDETRWLGEDGQSQ